MGSVSNQYQTFVDDSMIEGFFSGRYRMGINGSVMKNWTVKHHSIVASNLFFGVMHSGKVLNVKGFIPPTYIDFCFCHENSIES